MERTWVRYYLVLLYFLSGLAIKYNITMNIPSKANAVGWESTKKAQELLEKVA